MSAEILGNLPCAHLRVVPWNREGARCSFLEYPSISSYVSKTEIELSILSFLRQPSLKPAWTYIAPGTIWRLFPAATGELIGESRNQEKKVASFFAIDGRTGNRIWEGLTLDEPWWVGIEDVADGVLLLHKFGTPDMPGHLGIVGVDLQTGRTIWSNDQLTYWFAHERKLYAHRMSFEGRKFCEIDLVSGRIVREIRPEEEPEVLGKREMILKAGDNDLLFPEKGEWGKLDPEIAGTVVRAFPGLDHPSDPEFLVFNRMLVVNYHGPSKDTTPENHFLDNHLRIFDIGKSRLLYSDRLSHNVPAVVPDSFFIGHGMLYYVKDQQVLTAVNLLLE